MVFSFIFKLIEYEYNGGGSSSFLMTDSTSTMSLSKKFITLGGFQGNSGGVEQLKTLENQGYFILA